MSVHKYKQVCMHKCVQACGDWKLMFGVYISLKFLLQLFFVCVYLWCVHVIDAHYCVCLGYRFTFLGLAGSQTHTTVSGWITETHYCVWITDTHCCVFLDYTCALLCPAGLQIHTSLSGWIADTHYCIWLYSGLGIQTQFLMLVNQMFYPRNQPFSYS